MIDYSWKIAGCDVDENGIVRTIHWRLSAKEDSYQAHSYGSVDLKISNNQSNFIQYEKITKKKMTKWLFENLDKAEREKRLEEKILSQKSQNEKYKSLPWDKK